MATNSPDPAIETPGDLGDELVSFVRYLKAENVSPATVQAYGGAVVTFGRWCLAERRPTDLPRITKAQVEDWIGSILESGRKPTTAHQRFRGLQRFFNWYAEVDAAFASPMMGMRAPRLPPLSPRIFGLDEISEIIAACEGNDFESIRDEAIVRMLFNTGSRRAEIANLRYHPTEMEDRDIDLRAGRVRTLEKGRKQNLIGLDNRTLVALEAYLRARKKHPNRDLPWMWLGKRGRLTDSGVAQMLETRGKRIGIARLHAHDFRHTATHHEMSAGLSDSDVMAKRGWSSPGMLRRYAAPLAQQRSIAASQRLALGDKV